MGWKGIRAGALKTWGFIATFVTIMVLVVLNQVEQAMGEAVKSAFLQIAGPWLLAIVFQVVGVVLAWLPRDMEKIWRKWLLQVGGHAFQAAPFVTLTVTIVNA